LTGKLSERAWRSLESVLHVT